MLPKAITSFRKWPSSIRLFDEQRYRMLPHIEKERSDAVKQAIEDHIEDLEDLYLAQRVLERIADGRERLIPLEQVERELGDQDSGLINSTVGK